MSAALLEKLRAIALAFPGVSERLSHGAPCFFIGERPLCYFHDHHRGDDRISLWCPAPAGVQDELVSSEPARFFAPTPSASGAFSDWIGVHLDTDGEQAPDWTEIATILAEAYQLITHKELS